MERTAIFKAQGPNPCVVSDAEGHFRIDEVPAGECTIIVADELVETTRLRIVVPVGFEHPLHVRIDCPFLDCTYPGRPAIGPGCLRLSPDERARIGTPCPVHPGTRLEADTVLVSYGLRLAYPGQMEAERDSFPNARIDIDGGCIPRKTHYAEVAYCPECRLASARWYARRNHPSNTTGGSDR